VLQNDPNSVKLQPVSLHQFQLAGPSVKLVRVRNFSPNTSPNDQERWDKR